MTRDQLAKSVQEFCDGGAHKNNTERWCTERCLRVEILSNFVTFLNLPGLSRPRITEDGEEGQVSDQIIGAWVLANYGAHFSRCTPLQKQKWHEAYAELNKDSP